MLANLVICGRFRSRTNRLTKDFVVVVIEVVSENGGDGKFGCRENGVERLLGVKKVAMIVVELGRFFGLSNRFSNVD